MNKDQILKSPWAYNVNPDELETWEELCIWLEAMLSGPCGIWVENDGTTIVANQRALVERVKGMTIVINPNDHPPPHFHVKYSDNNVSIVIEDCAVLAGKIGNREYGIIKHWHQYSKSNLIEKWNQMRPTNCQVGCYRDNVQKDKAPDK